MASLTERQGSPEQVRPFLCRYSGEGRNAARHRLRFGPQRREQIGSIPGPFGLVPQVAKRHAARILKLFRLESVDSGAYSKCAGIVAQMSLW